MSLILPKKGWDVVDRRVFNPNGSFTNYGSTMYWRAIDSGLQFWDTKKQNQVIQKSTPLTKALWKNYKAG